MNFLFSYQGGKKNEINDFKEYIPKNYNKYIEVFGGGLALFFYLNPKNGVINDFNTNIYNIYQSIKNKSIINIINDIKAEYTNEEIDNFKKNVFTDVKSFLIISKLSFKGIPLHANNIILDTTRKKSLKFDNFNKYKDDILNLFDRTEIHNADFREIFKLYGDDTENFIFLDPPYINTHGYLIKFTVEDHIALSECIKNAKAKCLLIIQKSDYIKELYKGYIKKKYKLRYNMGNKNIFKDATRHLIVTNYDI